MTTFTCYALHHQRYVYISNKCVSYIEPPYVPILSHPMSLYWAYAQYRRQAMAQYRNRWGTRQNRHRVKYLSTGVIKLLQNTQKIDIVTTKIKHLPMAAVAATLELMLWKWKITHNVGKTEKSMRYSLSSLQTPIMVVREVNLVSAFKWCLI